ncbi:MAG: pseudouridine synthase [Acidobacteriota bacterium]
MNAPLPMLDGVGPSCQWLPEGHWKTVLDFLQQQFPSVTTETWASRMTKGEVVDETGRRIDEASPYRIGACVFYYRELTTEPSIPFTERILYEDEHILVADKPHFLPVLPAGRFLHETLLVRLRKQEKHADLVPVHRLDRETAGVVLFSLNPETRGLYTSLFRERKAQKVYEALAPSASKLNFPHTRHSRIVKGEPFFRMKEVPGEPNSETQIDLLREPAEGSLYRIVPVTGRKHQIRVHLAALGIPIINDKLYPQLTAPRELNGVDDFSRPLKLLAKSLSFQDPLSGREHYFETSRTLRESDDTTKP